MNGFVLQIPPDPAEADESGPSEVDGPLDTLKVVLSVLTMTISEARLSSSGDWSSDTHVSTALWTSTTSDTAFVLLGNRQDLLLCTKLLTTVF